MKYGIILLFLIGVFGEAAAQEIPKRFAFAKTYYGLDANYIPSYGYSTFINTDGEQERFGRNAYLSPSINIGATHFWGYADIYVSINTVNFVSQKEKVATSSRFGAFTGFRFYPMRLNDNGIRPYIGYKFSPFRYIQEDIDGSNFKSTQVKSTLDAGLGYRTPNAYFYAGYNRVMNPEIDIYLSKTEQAKTTFPSQFFNLGMNWMIETTNSSNSDINRHFHDEFSQSNVNGLFLGAGPSSAFQIGSSDYNETYYPYLDDKSQANMFPDLSIGYHFTKLDFITSVAYRPIRQTREAFDFTQSVNRNSLVLETYKFIGDYHGFVPFIGGGLSYESMTLREVDDGTEVTSIKQSTTAPLITFGWDIRPSRKGDWWLLRTNLRYAPNLNINHRDEKLSLSQLEFNFIQFVIYPQRLGRYKTYGDS